jgi:hypothetical protein
LNDQPTSGNRWERPDGQPSSDETAPVTQAPATRTGLRRHVTAARVKVGAVAAAIFLAGGAGGFGLAHAVSHDDQSSFVPGQGPDGDGNHRGFGGPNGGPNGVPPGDTSRQDGDGSDGNGPGSTNGGTAEDDT